MDERGDRVSALSTLDLYRLDDACVPIRRALGVPYLVGTAGDFKAPSGYRDVDVRLILDDAEFDALCHERRERWELLSVALGEYLQRRTGLPIDFQIQRMTEANARFGDKPRNPLGMVRCFAGGGDATPWTPKPVDPDAALGQQMEEIREMERRADRSAVIGATPSGVSEEQG